MSIQQPQFAEKMSPAETPQGLKTLAHTQTLAHKNVRQYPQPWQPMCSAYRYIGWLIRLLEDSRCMWYRQSWYAASVCARMCGCTVGREGQSVTNSKSFDKNQACARCHTGKPSYQMRKLLFEMAKPQKKAYFGNPRDWDFISLCANYTLRAFLAFMVITAYVVMRINFC